jgi:hypothetical protein
MTPQFRTLKTNIHTEKLGIGVDKAGVSRVI